MIKKAIAAAFIASAFVGCNGIVPEAPKQQMKQVDQGVYDYIYVESSKPLSIYLYKMTQQVNQFGIVIPARSFYEEETEEKRGLEKFLSYASPEKDNPKEIVEAYKISAKKGREHFTFYSPYPMKRGTRVKIYHRDKSFKIEAIIVQVQTKNKSIKNYSNQKEK